MKDILSDDNKIKNIIIDELTLVSKNYGQERNTQIIKDFVDYKETESSEIENYSVNFFLTKEGYFKKITPLSLRMSKDHKLKQSDDISQIILGNNTDELLFFSNKYQVYKTKAYDFEDIKASVMGDFLPVKLETESDENIIYMAAIEKYVYNEKTISELVKEGPELKLVLNCLGVEWVYNK